MKYIYILYQYLIATPIFLLLTAFTAIMSVICMPWRNGSFIHGVQVFWSRSFFYLMFIPVHVEGKENVSTSQSYVFVSNHTSMLDVWLIYGWLPNVFKWLMKKELEHVPFIGFGCKAAGHVFVDRSGPKASLESIKKVEKVLVNGVSTVIFPEGTRTFDGKLGRFKRGAFQIAFDLNLPVVPISLSGCYEAMSRKDWYITWHPVTMKIGKPISLAEFSKDNPQEAMDFVRARIEEGIVMG